MHWITTLWTWPKDTAMVLINKNMLVCTIKWETLFQSLQNKTSSFISQVVLITLLDFGAILLETCYLTDFH